jgi:divalent metal cation (Fe/Co/Zn/Cd) transporter
MNTRATDLQRALRLSVISIVWSGVAGSIAVYAALVSGSLSLLGFGADAVIDSVASIVLVWRFTVEARQPERAERVETAAERIVGLALVALALYLAFGAVRACYSPPWSCCRYWPSPSTGWPLVWVVVPCEPTASSRRLPPSLPPSAWPALLPLRHSGFGGRTRSRH